MLNEFEINILRFFRNISNNFLDFLMEVFSFLGEQFVVVIILALIYFIYDKKVGRKIAFVIFTSINLNGIIKGTVQRIRPFVYDLNLDPARLETATGYSFPSGHTQNSSTVFYTVSNHFKKNYLWIITILITILIGFSRIFLGVHYVTDVIVGMALGILCAFLFSYLYEKFATNFKNELILYISTFIISIPFVFIFFKKDYKEIEVFKDFYKSFALYFGYICAFIIDEKFINFDNNVSFKTKAVRLFGAGICYILINYGLKLILPVDNIFFVALRYFCITFITLGIYPLLFKKILFKKAK